MGVYVLAYCFLLSDAGFLSPASGRRLGESSKAPEIDADSGFMDTTTKRSLLGIGIAAALGLVLLVSTAQTAPKAQRAVQAAAQPTASTRLPSPAGTVPATTVKPVAATPAKPKPVERPNASTTTTAEQSPAPLTPEQEAVIQAGLDESDRENDPDHYEHQAEDYDLPSEGSTSTTVVDFEETTP